MRRHLVGIGPLLAALIVHLPPLALPLIGDDHHSLYQAALTWERPSTFLEPWMGGVFRGIPKLYFMGALEIFGTSPIPYRLVNLALHLFCVWSVSKLVRRLTGSRETAAIAALLFGLGLGGYLRAVFQISNVTLLGAAAFLLAAIQRAADSRWRSAIALFVPAALCHEVVLVAPVLVPLVRAAARPTARSGRRVGLATTMGLLLLATCAVVPLGRFHEIARRVLEQTWFVLFPINTPERIVRRIEVPPALVDPLLGVSHVLTDHRAWLGLGLLCVAAWIVRSREPRRVLAVSWTYLFLIPPAWLIVTAPELGPLWKYGWLERRYLYLPGIAVAALAGAAFLAHHARRPRLARAWLVALVAWVVLMDGITWDNYRRLSRTGDEQATRARFDDAMRELER